MAFADASGLGSRCSFERRVDVHVEGDGTLGTSSEDSLTVLATTTAAAPLLVNANFAVGNATDASLPAVLTVNGATGKVEMLGDVYVAGKFYSGSEFDMISLRLNTIDGRDVTDGPDDIGVEVEGVRFLQVGRPPPNL